MATDLLTRALEKARQIVCSMHGHDALLHFEQGRMSLQCTSCGYETPGWDLKGSPAQTAALGTRPRVVRMPLVREHRAA